MEVPTYGPFGDEDEEEQSYDDEDSEGERDNGDDEDVDVDEDEDVDENGGDEQDGEDDRENTPQNSLPIPGQFTPPPSMEEAVAALESVVEILRPCRLNGKPGHKDPKLDLLLRWRLDRMEVLLRLYTDRSNGPSAWIVASLQAAKDLGPGPAHARQTREWVRDFIRDRTQLPINIYST